MSTKGAAHHEEHWKVEADLNGPEIAAYVAETFGLHGEDERAPVGYAYAPLTGDLTLYRQHASAQTKPIGTREHAERNAEHARRKEERAARAKTASLHPAEKSGEKGEKTWTPFDPAVEPYHVTPLDVTPEAPSKDGRQT